MARNGLCFLEKVGVKETKEKSIFLNYTRLIPNQFKNKIVLDAGCGNGRYINIIKNFGPKFVIGVDISEASYVCLKIQKHLKMF